MNHIDHRLGQIPCEVYFFETWSGYSHPVRPEGPLEFERAMMRAKHYRAWLSRQSDQRLFLQFEGIEQSTEPIAGAPRLEKGETLRFFRAIRTDGGFAIGEPMSHEEVFDATDYVRSVPGEGGNVLNTLVHVRLALRFAYHYRPGGSLSKVLITNADGKTNTVEY
jgi:hypothetical protein